MDQSASGSSMTNYDIELDNIDTHNVPSNNIRESTGLTPNIDDSIDLEQQDLYTIPATTTQENVWERDYWNKKFLQHKRIIYLVISFLLFLLIIISLSKGKTSFSSSVSSTNATVLRRRGNPKGFTIDDIFNGEFDIPDQKTFHFIDPPEILTTFDKDPGLYFTTESTDTESRVNFVAKQLYSNEFRKGLGSNQFSYNGINYVADSVKISYRLDKIIFGTNIKTDFRHSSHGQYWIKDVDTGKIQPIVPSKEMNDPIDIQFAYFSPGYNFIYFHYANNIYIKSLYDESSGPIQITFDKDQNIINGKTDWIYEEEVLANDKAIWWAPDDSAFVFAQFDETDVPTYEFPLYTLKNQYDLMNQIKYPKPGTKNPTVSLFLFNMQNGVMSKIPTLNDDKECILYDVQWINNENFLFKITDRYSKQLQIIAHNSKKQETTFIRSIDTTKFNGWTEKMKKMVPILPNKRRNRDQYGYLDIHQDNNGFEHIFYYPKINSKDGIQLTFGNWEITGNGIVGVNYDDNIIYFTSNKISNMGQHLYAVHLNKDKNGEKNLVTLQDPNQIDNFYDFIFSSSTRYAVMKLQGGKYPQSWVGATNDIFTMDENTLNNSDKIITLMNLDKLQNSMTKYDYPITSYKSMVLQDGVEINYVEIKPKHIDAKKKYPLLVNVYGGPGSITFTKKSSILLEQSVASGLDSIVLQIEPRGTGGKGWDFKSWALNKLGYWEPRDVTEVTKRFIQDNKGIIDEEKIAIWGWSYGGFTTLKTIEFDEGNTFKYAIAVAPVTNWKYYDSIYTERYMGSLKDNVDGYNQIARLSNLNGLSKLKKFMLIHGTADDNVHIQNTYDLVDELTLHNIKNYEMEIFPDSDHTIKFHNAQRIIFRRLYSWFEDAFSGRFESYEQMERL